MEELLCPKCGSDKLTADKKGFSGKKAVAGAILTGGVGLLAGTIGSNKVKITCLSCGHEFKPGEGAKSKSDFQKKKAMDKKSGKVGMWIIGIILSLVLLSKMCGDDKNKKNKNSVKTEQNNKVTVVKLSDDEYINLYKQRFDSIILEKRFGQAPLYGVYADNLNLVLLDMEKNDSLFHIFKNPKLKSIYESNYKNWKQSVSNYLKYGEPDEDLININAACKVALKKYLNDPDYEVVKDSYYLKQTSSGYNYKMKIRARNRFGALILKELMFQLIYIPSDKLYQVIQITE